MASGIASALRRTSFLVLASLAATASGLAQTAPTCPLRGSCNLETGLVGRTDLLLFEDWEASIWPTHWTLVELPGNTSLVTTPPPFAGASSLEVRVPQGTHDGATLHFDFTSAGLAEPEEMYARYYVRFNDSWQLTQEGEIGKFPGFSGTYGRCAWGQRRPDGTCWSARMNSVDRGGKNQVGFYVYHVDQPFNFGESWYWPPLLNRNQWYCIEQRVKLNTISGSTGNNDGILEGWIDDVLAFTRSNIRFRDVASTKIEEYWWNIYVGGSWVADRNMSVHFDNAVIARNRIGCAGSALPPPPPLGCQISSALWQNSPYAAQSGIFTARFDVTPNTATLDGVTGLAAGSAAAFTDLAAIVRFNTAGLIDARNGGVYAALTPIPYVAGSTYRVRMVVNIPAHTYSVYVTPPGASEQAVGINYAFRTEQSTVTALNTLALSSSAGTHTVCNVTVGDLAPPAAPTRLTVQ